MEAAEAAPVAARIAAFAAGIIRAGEAQRVFGRTDQPAFSTSRDLEHKAVALHGLELGAHSAAVGGQKHRDHGAEVLPLLVFLLFFCPVAGALHVRHGIPRQFPCPTLLVVGTVFDGSGPYSQVNFRHGYICQQPDSGLLNNAAVVGKTCHAANLPATRAAKKDLMTFARAWTHQSAVQPQPIGSLYIGIRLAHLIEARADTEVLEGLLGIEAGAVRLGNANISALLLQQCLIHDVVKPDGNEVGVLEKRTVEQTRCSFKAQLGGVVVVVAAFADGPGEVHGLRQFNHVGQIGGEKALAGNSEVIGCFEVFSPLDEPKQVGAHREQPTYVLFLHG